MESEILSSVISGMTKNTNVNSIPGRTSAYGIFRPARTLRSSVTVSAAIELTRR